MVTRTPEPVLKSKAERVADWQESAGKMVNWFKDIKELPPEPVKVTKYSKILNVKRFVENQTAIIEGNINQPFNRVFKLAYLRLYELKKFIENAQSGAINSK